MTFKDFYDATLALVGPARSFSIKVEASQRVPSKTDNEIKRMFGRPEPTTRIEVEYSIYVKGVSDETFLTDEWPTPEEALRELAVLLAKGDQPPPVDLSTVGDPAKVLS